MNACGQNDAAMSETGYFNEFAIRAMTYFFFLLVAPRKSQCNQCVTPQPFIVCGSHCAADTGYITTVITVQFIYQSTEGKWVSSLTVRLLFFVQSDSKSSNLWAGPQKWLKDLTVGTGKSLWPCFHRHVSHPPRMAHLISRLISTEMNEPINSWVGKTMVRMATRNEKSGPSQHWTPSDDKKRSWHYFMGQRLKARSCWHMLDFQLCPNVSSRV